MPREKKADKLVRAAEIERRMYEHYGEGACSLDHTTPFQLTCAVVLSAQCTDAAVNKVTPELFSLYGTPEAMAAASVEDIERIIHPLGFFRSKARNLVKLGRMVVSEFGGEIPNDMELLQKLPGVGRKTANVVMCQAFRNAQGIAVDTHVFRISRRLRFSDAPTPLACEQDLLALLPHELWGPVNEQWIHFGRDTCTAHAPACDGCPLMDLCPSCGKAEGNPEKKKR